MELKRIAAGEHEIVQVISDDILIRNEQDALDLMANAGAQYIVLSDSNFERDFFDLSTRKLGSILQKFTTYFVKLAVIGDFEAYPSKILKEFIYESNKRGEYLFVKSLEDAVKRWCES
ncbi:DUF4180 domain-containing protein [Candidatus Roizmanbacteria bacterium]|nr:MAG: DUF4180 domain-containing protein [Candidatus Roizmanbacteria bacterium]